MQNAKENPTILFLCTGNYYRSRYAEILFNELATRRGLAWRADSRGLALERGVLNVGPISSYAVDALLSLGIRIVVDGQRFPRALSNADLDAAQRVIALKEAEHRPLLAERFPGWADRVEYWHVHDLDAASAADALAQIEKAVVEMIEEMCRADQQT